MDHEILLQEIGKREIHLEITIDYHDWIFYNLLEKIHQLKMEWVFEIKKNILDEL